jgi:transcription elongation factor Elf1
MKYINPPQRVPSAKEIMKGKQVCSLFNCPHCGKQYVNSKADPNWVKPGAEVTCDNCGKVFTVD